jgi:hypothetical protein
MTEEIIPIEALGDILEGGSEAIASGVASDAIEAGVGDLSARCITLGPVDFFDPLIEGSEIDI